MLDSILTSTKKVLGVGADYDAFDEDILMFINTAFSVINQLGVGPTDVVIITDAEKNWSDLTNLPTNQLGLLKTYVFLRARMLFDPPATSFLIDAMNTQLKEYEYRLSYFREDVVTIAAQAEEVNNEQDHTHSHW